MITSSDSSKYVTFNKVLNIIQSATVSEEEMANNLERC